jgi:Domain of unknown function (DUF4268)
MPIGKLQRLAIKKVWPHEEYDFCRWLQENIDVLNETVNLTLIGAERNRSAGSFKVDLVAEDSDGSKIIIENQYGRSDHDHLGKLITYLSKLGATGAIWIVETPNPEHVTAINWLNENSSGSFYLVKVEALKIGDSEPAPLLTLIVGPSDDKGDVAETNREFSVRHDLRKKWWQQLVGHPGAKAHAHITPGTNPYITTTSGFPGIVLGYTITKDSNSAELYIDLGKDSELKNKKIFDTLTGQKSEIEKSMGRDLIWQRLDGRRASRIKCPNVGGYSSPETEWGQYINLQVETMHKLEQAIRPVLKLVKLDS